jgi:hypothetical protein
MDVPLAVAVPCAAGVVTLTEDDAPPDKTSGTALLLEWAATVVLTAPAIGNARPGTHDQISE